MYQRKCLKLILFLITQSQDVFLKLTLIHRDIISCIYIVPFKKAKDTLLGGRETRQNKATKHRYRKKIIKCV